MTVQRPDQYIICRDELNYRITADRLKKELGGEQPGAVMAFYQAAAPHGWEQLADSEYTVGGTVKTFEVIPTAPLFDNTGSNLEQVMKVRKVPIPAHSHGFTDNGHKHGDGSAKHGHTLTDPSHGHTALGGNVGRHEHTLGVGGNKDDFPDHRIYRTEDHSNPDTENILLNTDSGTGGGGLPSSKTGVTINNGTGSKASSGAKTNLTINDSADNSNNFSVKYSNVILCRKK